jgi:hypothetical protein
MQQKLLSIGAKQMPNTIFRHPHDQHVHELK